MVNRIPITQARINLGAVVKRAHLNGDYFILEKGGIPIAGIMDGDELEDYLELRDPKIKKQTAASRKDAEAGRVRDATDLMAELTRLFPRIYFSLGSRRYTGTNSFKSQECFSLFLGRS